MNYVDNIKERYPALAPITGDIEAAVNAIVDCYKSGGKILLCGNGGSAADSEHISGELLKGFMSLRQPTEEEMSRLAEALGDDEAAGKLQRGIPAIPLTSLSASLSAFANDVEPDMVYAQLVYGYARENDLVIGLSTSGNSKNVVNAMKAAKAMGIAGVSLTGAKESKLSALSNVTIRVPETETFKVQELHLPVYHYLCAQMEAIVFEN